MGPRRDYPAPRVDGVSDASVRAYPEGPLIVRGDVRVEDESGRSVPTGAIVALCRCGRSRIPPLCDGLHAAGAGPACDRRAATQRGQSSS